LFNGKVLLPRKGYSIRFDNETSKFILDAGEAHGIAIGAEFKAYSDFDKSLEHSLGTFIVEKLSPFTSVMSTTSSTLLDQQVSAIQTKAGKVERFHLYIPPGDPFRVYYDLVRALSSANLESVFLVHRPEEAHLKACTMPDRRILFVHTDKRVTLYATNLVTDWVKPDSDPLIVGNILESAARYFHELDRTRHATNLQVTDGVKADPLCAGSILEGAARYFHRTRYATNLVTDEVKADPFSVHSILESAARYFHDPNQTPASQYIEDHITVEFYQLKPPIRLPGVPILEHLAPVGPNLCREKIISLQNFICRQKIIDFVVEGSNIPYGFKIVNPTAEDLYVNAFYFDSTNFSICESQYTLAFRDNMT